MDGDGVAVAGDGGGTEERRSRLGVVKTHRQLATAPGTVMVTVCLETTGFMFQFGGSLVASRYQPRTDLSLPTAAPQTPDEEVDVSGPKPEKSTPLVNSATGSSIVAYVCMNATASA